MIFTKHSMGGGSKMDVVEGVVVNPEIHESQRSNFDNVVSGRFIEKEVYDEVFRNAKDIGERSANLIYSPAGRARIDALIDKIKKGINRNFFAPSVRKSQLIWAVKSEECDGLDKDQKDDLNLLNRSIRFIHDNQTSLVNVSEGFEHNALKISAQNKGFREGFNGVFEKSSFKNQSENEKPWYLRKNMSEDPYI